MCIPCIRTKTVTHQMFETSLSVRRVKRTSTQIHNLESGDVADDVTVTDHMEIIGLSKY